MCPLLPPSMVTWMFIGWLIAPQPPLAAHPIHSLTTEKVCQKDLSRNDTDGFGSATSPHSGPLLCCSDFPVALVGPRASVRPIICSDLSPISRTMILPTVLGAGPKDGRVFGETPKTAVETTALPKATASFRLRLSITGRAHFCPKSTQMISWSLRAYMRRWAKAGCDQTTWRPASLLSGSMTCARLISS